MNEIALRTMGLHKKIESNRNLSIKCKMLAGACLFFSICYCLGTKSIENIDKAQVILTNMVWISSVMILIGLYIKDASYMKKNKVYELDIYKLEVQDLNNKKEIAKIRGEGLPDYILNKQIIVPGENVSLPTIYYSVFLGIDFIIRIYLL